jgi:DNA repair protein RecN (Recombination protein N)
VGDKLSALAASHQVLCITHLPQIAARGDQHLLVNKQVVAGRTKVAVSCVEGESREKVLAEMLSGREVDNASLLFAKRLLERR